MNPINDLDAISQPRHHFVGRTYIRELHLPLAGLTALSHKHATDHASILGSGSVLFTVDGLTSRIDAPAVIEVPAGKVHSVTALTDNVTWFCIHSIPRALAESKRVEDVDAVVIAKE